MNNKLFIPKTISVGYQERSDTYTGKLGYVIYTDSKGVLRKANSWNSWRDDKIKPDEFDNTPQSGFILNRDVGGTRHSYGWNARIERVRVYDPRGFEFEISIPNLLFILQECTSSKGKGLEGEFVYSWQGKELVLIPTTCKEYKDCIEFTSLQGKKVSARDLIPGATYLTKDMTEKIYLGRFSWYSSKSDYDYSWNANNSKTTIEIIDKKYHIFYDPKTTHFEPFKSMSKLASVQSETCVDNYAELVEKYESSIHGSKPVDMVVRKKNPKTIADLQGYYYTNSLLLKRGDDFFGVSVDNVYFDYNKNLGVNVRYSYKYDFDINKIVQDSRYRYDSNTNLVNFPNLKRHTEVRKGVRTGARYTWRNDETREFYDEGDILQEDWYEVKMKTESGKEYNILKYMSL